MIGIIEKNFKKYKKNNFKFKVSISKKTYIKMIQNRYISILLSFSEKDIKLGILEIDTKYPKKIHFNDILNCIMYQKKN